LSLNETCKKNLNLNLKTLIYWGDLFLKKIGL